MTMELIGLSISSFLFGLGLNYLGWMQLRRALTLEEHLANINELEDVAIARNGLEDPAYLAAIERLQGIAHVSQFINFSMILKVDKMNLKGISAKMPISKDELLQQAIEHALIRSMKLIVMYTTVYSPISALYYIAKFALYRQLQPKERPQAGAVKAKSAIRLRGNATLVVEERTEQWIKSGGPESLHAEMGCHVEQHDCLVTC